MEIVHIKNPNFEMMKKIVEIEQEVFEGNGNVDLWIIKALIRYGLVFVIKENDEIVCIVEYMQVFNKKSLFLYGISTLKKYRHKGYANYILNTGNFIILKGFCQSFFYQKIIKKFSLDIAIKREFFM